MNTVRESAHRKAPLAAHRCDILCGLNPATFERQHRIILSCARGMAAALMLCSKTYGQRSTTESIYS